jgi:hypothetical protein
LLFLVSYITKGIPNRFDQNFLSYYLDANKYSSKLNSCNNKVKANCGNNYSSSTILVYGDSHAAVFENFFKELAIKDPDFSFNFLTSDNCAPARDITNVNPRRCMKLRKMFDEKLDKYKTVILIARWDKYFYNKEKNNTDYTPNYSKKLNGFIKRLNQQGKKVILIAQVPNYNINLKTNEFITKRFGFNVTYKMENLYIKSNEQINKIINQHKKGYYISFNKFLCKNNSCSPYDYATHRLIYCDDHHLNIQGAISLADKLISSKDYRYFKEIILVK